MASKLATLCLCALAVALPGPASHVLHEERDAAPARWMKRNRVPPRAILPVRIGLVQSNIDNAHEHLMDVSHPESSNYGKHWTSEEVVEFFKPSDETVDAVRNWLVDSGIDRKTITHSDNKAWFAFHATAQKMESLLRTEYHEYEDMHTGGIMPSCDKYHLPKHIQKHIDYISPGVKLMAPTEKPTQKQKRSLAKHQWPHEGPSWNHDPWHSGPWPKLHEPIHPMPYNTENLSTCDIAITPACIRALYQIPLGHLADPGNSMGIFEAELQYWDQLDLNLFFANFTRWIPNGTHPINRNVDGGVSIAPNISAAGEEALLDLEMAYPIVYPQTITFWDVDDIHYQYWLNDTYTWGFNTLLDAIDGSYCTYCAYGECGNAPGIDPKYPDINPSLGSGYNGTLQCGVYKPTNVYSVSYGGQEADVPVAYQKRQCNEYLKLGLQGVSFLVASGDAGVGNYPAPYGTDNPKTGCLGHDGLVFNPTWPGNCPWITGVGATKVYPGKTVFEPESAVFDPVGHPYAVNYSSGGGFSNVYPVPEYQKKAVSTYFANHNPPYPYYSGLVANAPNPVLPNVTALAGNSGGIYNRQGRGKPDVAANGDNGAVYAAGNFTLGGGTSQATPIFAAIVSDVSTGSEQVLAL